MKSDIIFKSIGKIQSKKALMSSSLVMDRRLNAALDGIEAYSYLIIIYHMHRVTGTKGLKIHPQGRKEIAKVGLFATRSPNRPNPIGVTVVKLLERSGNIVKVRGLDAVNGTPILDIKPYSYTDVKRKIRIPKWTK